MAQQTGNPRIGRPKKQVSDQARAEILTEAMRDAARIMRESSKERRRVAVEAYGLGMTLDAIGEACEVSARAVSTWVHASREGSGQSDGAEG